MLKLVRVTGFKMLFLVLVFIFNFDLFKFSAAILEKGLFLQNDSPLLNTYIHNRQGNNEKTYAVQLHQE